MAKNTEWIFNDASEPYPTAPQAPGIDAKCSISRTRPAFQAVHQF